MCVSVGVGTIYAVGQVTVRLSADTITGPALYMKFGFGVEAVVALPVIGSVSVYFAAGVEMLVSSTEDTIGGFILFRGRAEILGGIVTVTIQIEASGKVQNRIGDAQTGKTTMIAQVIFSLDISICFIIDINFTEQWSEQRQIS
jgi:Zn-dependent protease